MDWKGMRSYVIFPIFIFWKEKKKALNVFKNNGSYFLLENQKFASEDFRNLLSRG